jgi:5-methylthioadenosine/S-adenosylhomocysteine deaminase
VDLRTLNLTPVVTEPIRNIVPNLVYAATGREVDVVMVAGRILVRDGCLLNVDEATVRAEAQEAAQELAAAVVHDPIHHELALLDAMDKGWL